MLNDISRATRASVCCQMVGLGLMLSGAFAGHRFLMMLWTGLLVYLVGAAAFVVWTQRADRAFRTMVDRGSAEIVSGAVAATPCAGRVVRRRRASTSPAYTVGSSEPVAGGADILVVTALTDPPRRVAALVPAAVGRHLRGRPVALALHPKLPEVAVLDDTVPAERLAAIGVDPRWQGRLPTDRTVLGGYLPLLGYAVLGVLLGAALGWATGALTG